MADELDLERGNPDAADSTGERRRRRREASSGSTTSRAEKQAENEIRSGLTSAFDRLAKYREARDDDELAEALREESGAMTEGIVDLTEGVPFLRNPIVVILHLLIVLLAFGRVGGIILTRWQVRREMRAMQAEQEYAPGVEVVQ